ncbi:probable ATP-binding cassette multidrug transport protein [Phialocephala subalpina]|uniref:Probable ATP-binding cassette multidrug transport protein n=1 Tax=Phialocephala subalpina TaxID=576137 RepID=A0A1L7XLT8_9HELO|nr:probable ATP-binding cassette multidrug transport protein [Phialocephala subalpina]
MASQLKLPASPAEAEAEHGENLITRVLSHISAFSARIQGERFDDDADDNRGYNIEDWAHMPEVKAIQGGDGSGPHKSRRLGITWKDLTIKGVGADACFNESIASQLLPGKLKGGGASLASLRTIINNSHGCVKPGEMLLVLGRPGAGCTTLLKVLSNRRAGFTDVDGQVNFGSLDYKEAARYRGQIVMNTEEEIFFPTLTVGQTIDFATRMKMPTNLAPGFSSAEHARVASRDFLLELLGISHTFDTKVGNEYIRGVSGGERKRVSIIETMATRGSIYCWDNPTRGLDASTALQYIKAVRDMTSIFGLASIVTIYQAGNGIYDLFDKVLVLDEGKEIYYGPLKAAKPFMEDLGFVCPDGANVADFLTGVTVPTERIIRPGFEMKFPRNAEAILTQYQISDIKKEMEAEYDYPTTQKAKEDTEEFAQAIEDEKHPSILMKKLPVTVRFTTQLKAAVRRQYQIIRGDMAVLIIKQVSNIIQALTSGSLFYNTPNNSSGIFIKSGALFVALLFNSLVALSEVTDSFLGRPVLAKHKSFALYHPAAFCLAQIGVDLPVYMFQVSAFSLILYFMVGLTSSASVFFTFWFIVFSTTMCMTALFRAIGAAFSTFDAASKLSGFLVSSLLMYNGYMIPKTEMHPWFGWIFWVDPLAYAYDALLSNEFHDKILPCVGTNLVPNGPGYSAITNQACTGVRGALRGATSVTGEQYLESLKYSYSHMWRNVGIVWVLWAFFVFLTIMFTSAWKEKSRQSGLLLVPRDLSKKPARLPPQDEEAHVKDEQTAVSSNSSATKVSQTTNGQLIQNTSVFTWKNLTYTVQTTHGPRVLLNNVHGWVKPGMLGALMGSSGAGKTTLLDVLAQRKVDGTIKGSVLVDGHPLSISFQRSAGYCEQLDVHESLATVREALEFSALLRQSRTIPKEEKLKYVDVIVDLLEMHDIENCLIGTTGGAGLSVEQRKRLTIGVELVAKPSILIFLDEPTSGLDGQAAYNIIRFLKKLAAVGQAILVTIHQPSAQLFSQFDTLLLLAKGGNTVYFGDIGENGSHVKEYFERYDAPCPPNANPAEHMIDVVSGHGKDWNKVWLESPEHDKMLAELDRMVAEANSSPPRTTDDGFEFAMPLWDQIKIVTTRMSVAMWRNTGYVNNKFSLHIIIGLFTGFSFWKVGNSVGDLQLRLFAIFQFIFVAPGVIAQLQPLFIEKRDIYEAREKKSKMYSWIAFVTGLIVAELPYLVLCAIQFFLCFYYTVGFSGDSSKAGAVVFVMLMYEFVYTGIGQFIAAYAPNAVAASLINPLVIFTLVGFCGVLVPYSQMTEFWRYWLYYIDPFKYLMGALLMFTTHDVVVTCKESEFAVFEPLANQTCREYLGDYMQQLGSGTNLTNPDATTGCRVCQYKGGSDYLRTLNLPDYYYGWRDAAIVVIFVFSSYGLVYLLMKLRTKKTKTAE